MPTRRQDPEHRSFNQSAYASSTEFDRGILGNLAAARCQQLTDREEIKIHWWLQQISWREGGMDAFSRAFLDANHSLIGTKAMHKFGIRKGQNYSAEQVRAIRPEMQIRDVEGTFPLRGEEVGSMDDFLDSCVDYAQRLKQDRERAALASLHPISYPAAKFVDECEVPVEVFSNALKEALVNPRSDSLREGFWNFPDLWPALLAWRQREIEASRGRIVETQIATSIYEALDFAHESKSFTLIEGREGVGKSAAARAWCERNPGSAIYVSLGSGTDELTLFRSIARALGTACSLSRTPGDIKARIEEALRPGHLTLVLDEAHFLWPQSERAQRSAPRRVDWLRTALIDEGVPVVLISTPQYFKRQCDRFRKGGWNANQIQRRLGHTLALPEALGKADALAMARFYFPHASPTEAAQIAYVSALTTGYLTTMVHLKKRVDFFKSRKVEGSESVPLERAIDEVCAQHGLNLDAAAVPNAQPVQTSGNRLSPALHRAGKSGMKSSDRASAGAEFSRIHANETDLIIT
jgi:hypothetical protein